MNNQRAYFDEAAHRYPTPVDPPLAQQLEVEHLERALGSIPGKTVMDFGAGSGRVTFWFLKKGYDVTAVDISPQSLSDLVRHYKQYKQPSWGILLTSSKLPNIRYDAIVGADILHHVDMKEYLPRLYSILKSGGRIAFSEPNAWFLPWYAYIVLRRLPWSIEKGILQITIPKIKQGLERAKFSDISIHGFLFHFRLIITAAKNHLTV